MHPGPVVLRHELDGRPAWLLTTRNTATLLCLGPNDALLLPYWGPASTGTRPTDLVIHPQGNRPSQREFLDGRPVAYPVYGDATFKEVCLVVARADGLRECRLSFVEDRVSDVDACPVLDLVFSDAAIGLEVTHRFQVFAQRDLIARCVTIENRGNDTLVLERALSAAMPLAPGAYDALTLNGQWGREFQLHQRPLLPGKLTVESRRGLSSHEAHPWFAVRPRGEQSEDSGQVWFGSFAWSGNWIFSLEVESNDAVHIAAGCSRLISGGDSLQVRSSPHPGWSWDTPTAGLAARADCCTGSKPTLGCRRTIGNDPDRCCTTPGRRPTSLVGAA